MIELYTLIALWCGPVVNGDAYPIRSTYTVQGCRERLMKCVDGDTSLKQNTECFKKERLAE